MLKKYLKFPGLGLAILLLMWLIMSRGMFLGIQRDLQNKFYDYDSASTEIVVVAIDEKSLQEDELGALTQWPRANYSKAIEVLNKNKAAAIGIDITFPDSSNRGNTDDQNLADTLAQHDNVVIAARYFFDQGKRRFEWPNRILSEANPTLGWINIQLDPDGFVRSLPISSDSERGQIDAFSLALSRIYLRDLPEIPVMTEIDGGSGEEVTLMYINYFAEPNQFTRISFTDLLDENLVDKKGNPIDFRDKIAIIGPTAIDLQDDYLSPVSSGVRMPGVEIHANNVQTVITGQFLRDQTRLSLLITLLAILVINIFAFSILKVRYSIILTFLEIFGMLVAGIVVYEYRILVNVVYPILMILMTFVGTYLLRFIMEQKERKFIEGAFGHYVNKDVVKQIEKDPNALKLGGDKRDLSILFSDIQGFTSISEKMQPEELVAFLNEYLGEMTDLILKNQGTLDKYEGDAVMCFWNAPIPLEDHALSACLTALEQQKRLVELRDAWGKKGLPEMQVRIGINTGEAVVGNMGSENRFNYTAMGDNVNLASRLESINKQYGTFLMISEYTYELVKDQLVCRELDQIRVKGKNEPVRVYELVGKKGETDNEAKLKDYADALKLYRASKFEEAKAKFESLTGDAPAKVFVKRCEDFINKPPASDWGGVWNFEVK